MLEGISLLDLQSVLGNEDNERLMNGDGCWMQPMVRGSVTCLRHGRVEGCYRTSHWVAQIAARIFSIIIHLQRVSLARARPETCFVG